MLKNQTLGKGSFSKQSFLKNVEGVERNSRHSPFFSTASPSSGDLSDDFTDDFHISGVKEKAEIPDKYKEFRLHSSSGRET